MRVRPIPPLLERTLSDSIDSLFDSSDSIHFSSSGDLILSPHQRRAVQAFTESQRIRDLQETLISSAGDIPTVAKVKAGNTASLDKMPVATIAETDEEHRKNSGHGLIHEAALYKEKRSLDHLLDKVKLGLPKNETELRGIYFALFLQHGSYDSAELDPADIIDVFNRINQEQQSQGLDKIIDLKNILSEFLVRAAHVEATETMLALLAEDLEVKINPNMTDEHGHTALYYVMMSDDIEKVVKSALLETLDKLGARLNNQDKYALEQNATFELVRTSIRQDGPDCVRLVKALVEDPVKIRPKQFKLLLEDAIRNINDQQPDVQALEILLQHHYMSHIEFYNYMLDMVEHPNAARALMSYIAKSNLQPELPPYGAEQKLREIINEASHRIGLTGDIHVYSNTEQMRFALDGNKTINSLNILDAALSAYQPRESDKDAYANIKEAVAFANVTLNIRSYKTMTSLFVDRYQNGELIMFPCGWEGHAVGIAMKFDGKNTTVTISNRGDGDIRSCIPSKTFKNLPESVQKAINANPFGTVTFHKKGKIEEPQRFFSGFLKENSRAINAKRLKQSDFEKAIEKEIKSFKFGDFLPSRPQGKGTCSYVNPKRSIEGALYIHETADKGKEPCTKLFDEIYNSYKHFSTSDKQKASERLAAFYTHYTSNSNIDKNPLIIEALNQLMALGIMMHHEKKLDSDRDINIGRTLYYALSEDAKANLDSLFKLEIIPEKIKETPNVTTFTMFGSRQKNLNRQQELTVTGDVQGIKKHGVAAQKIIEFLKQNNLINKIRQIHFDKDHVLVFKTSPARKFKYEVINAIQEKLELEVDIVRGPEFRIHYDELHKKMDSSVIENNTPNKNT